jgi:hypothetical protein
MSGDSIDSLPTDQSVPSHNEIQVVESLFKQKHTTVQKLLSGAKDSVILLALYVVFSLPIVDSTISKFVDTSQTPYLMIGVKAVLFVIAYFLITNMYLVRK